MDLSFSKNKHKMEDSYDSDESGTTFVYNIKSSDNPLVIKIPFNAKTNQTNYSKRKPRVYIDSFSFVDLFFINDQGPAPPTTAQQNSFTPPLTAFPKGIILACEEARTSSEIFDKDGNDTNIIEYFPGRINSSMLSHSYAIQYNCNSSDQTVPIGTPVNTFSQWISREYYMIDYTTIPQNKEDGFELGSSFRDTITLSFYSDEYTCPKKNHFVSTFSNLGAINGDLGTAPNSIIFEDNNMTKLYDFKGTSSNQFVTIPYGFLNWKQTQNIRKNNATYFIRLRICF